MRFDAPTQGKMDLPLSELCEEVNPPGRSSERYGRWTVGTYTHLHAAHAPRVLAAITVEGGYSRGRETGQARQTWMFSARRSELTGNAGGSHDGALGPCKPRNHRVTFHMVPVRTLASRRNKEELSASRKRVVKTPTAVWGLVPSSSVSHASVGSPV